MTCDVSPVAMFWLTTTSDQDSGRNIYFLKTVTYNFNEVYFSKVIFEVYLAYTCIFSFCFGVISIHLNTFPLPNHRSVNTNTVIDIHIPMSSLPPPIWNIYPDNCLLCNVQIGSYRKSVLIMVVLRSPSDRNPKPRNLDDLNFENLSSHRHLWHEMDMPSIWDLKARICQQMRWSSAGGGIVQGE